MLPLAPLLEALPSTDVGDGATMTNAERVLGVGRQRLRGLARRGLTVYEADEFAGKLQKHPTEIWPEWSLLEPATCIGCGNEIPAERNPTAIFCNRLCANNAKAKRYRAAKRAA